MGNAIFTNVPTKVKVVLGEAFSGTQSLDPGDTIILTKFTTAGFAHLSEDGTNTPNTSTNRIRITLEGDFIPNLYTPTRAHTVQDKAVVYGVTNTVTPAFASIGAASFTQAAVQTTYGTALEFPWSGTTKPHYSFTFNHPHAAGTGAATQKRLFKMPYPGTPTVTTPVVATRNDSWANTVFFDPITDPTSIPQSQFKINPHIFTVFQLAAVGDMNVKEGATPIPDGETTARDFGSVAKDDTGPTKTFTVENLGDLTITVASVVVPTGYTVTESLDTTILGGASDTFTVRLDTAIVGVKSGDIVIDHDAPAEDPYNFAITGEVTGASSLVAREYPRGVMRGVSRGVR